MPDLTGSRPGAIPPAAPALRPGLMPRLLLTWRAPGRVLRAQAHLTEGALFGLLLIAAGLLFVAQLPVHARAAALDPSIPVEARLAGALVGAGLLLPLLAYGIAALLALVVPRLDGHASRLALFWALLAVSPLMLLAGLVEGYLGTPAGLQLLRGAIFAAFLWFWIAGIRALRGPA